MKKVILSIALFTALVSCGVFGSLTSNTRIKPNDSFLLGNNEHGNFKVQLKNVSNHDIEIYFAPIAGGTHSRQIVKMNQKISTKVNKNTAIVIENKSSETASVDLVVTGDLGLAMTYKN